MAKQGKQMRVGTRGGFAYHPVKPVLLAYSNWYWVESSMFLLPECQTPLSVQNIAYDDPT
jgi:hypothetical protein